MRSWCCAERVPRATAAPWSRNCATGSANSWEAIAKPDNIRFADNLPKTRSGKIMRRLLRAIANDQPITQDISTLENPAIVDQLRGVDTPGAGAAAHRKPGRNAARGKMRRKLKRASARKPARKAAPTAKRVAVKKAVKRKAKAKRPATAKRSKARGGRQPKRAGSARRR